jgi:tetratricopeptide (TPR) repeat protein
MLKGRSLLVILSALLCCPPNVGLFQSLSSPWSAWVQGATSQRSMSPARPMWSSETPHIQPLFSPSVAERFYEIAYELAHSENITTSQAKQAILLLIATKELGSATDQIHPLLIKLACEHSKQDYSQEVYSWLNEYISESIDLEIAKKAITYLLDRCDTREQRERALEQLRSGIGGKNAAVDSELATLLGMLMVEKADFNAALSLFVRAYLNDRYNELAFAKLVELAPEKVSPAIYFEHLRLMLRENPLDIEAALAFAQYAESAHSGHLYEIASAAYQYCVDLFTYLYPNEPLPPDIYLPWIISNYNTEQNRSRCLQIAELVRRSGRFDILVEVIAGRAATKMGKIDEANRIFQAAELKVQQLLGKSHSGGPGAVQLAWFYCFARQDGFKALDWANKAYSADSNSAVAAALLAYALVMNKQLEWAKPLIENYEHNQIADLVRAQIQLAEGQKEAAIETLKTAIFKDPGSLAAERAKELLVQQGQQYKPPVDPDYILSVLGKSFGQAIVPEFISPDKIISVQFRSSTNEFSYGGEFGPTGQITITNNSSEPLIISDNSLFNGNIRIDANISGDLNRRIPNLVSLKIGSISAIKPGKNMIIPVHLAIGELRMLLLSHPQASLNIEFTLYLDPINISQTEQSEIANKLVGVKPAKFTLRRPGIELSSSFLQNRLNSISTAQASQKISIAELFVGLLNEQHTMAEHGALYRYKYADWMPSFLKSALLQESGLLLNSAEDEWVVKVHTMAEMLSLPLDTELMNAVAKNLNHPKWPVRMMAVYLLAKSSENTFDKVLSWVAENDSSQIVRDMAVALSAK